MAADHRDSTIMDTEFDILEEMGTIVDDIDRAFEQADTASVPESLAYLRFLLRDLGDVLSGEYEGLRRRRFITKQTR